MNRDSRVTEFLAAPITGPQSDALVDRIEAHFEAHGFGLWAVEVAGQADFAGFIGLSIPRYETPFMPCVEVGWRLDPDHWGQGYATEGARAAVRFGFERAGLTEIVSFTTISNLRSRRVMEKIGMRKEGHFRECIFRRGKWIDEVFYSILSDEWVERTTRPEGTSGKTT